MAKPKILDRFRNAVQAFANTPQKNFPLPIVWHVANTGTYQWHMIDYEAYAKEGFSQNAVIYSALKYKYDAVSQAPLRAYEGHPDNAEIYQEMKHPLVQLALRPNDYQSRVEFMQYCLLYLNLHGNCYIYVTGLDNDQEEVKMYSLRPDRVAIVPQMKGRTRAKNVIMGYAYYPDGMSQENVVPILPQNMMHIKFPNPYDPLEGQGYGLSPLSAGATSGDTDNAMTNFLANYFRNQGIMPGGVITLPYEADSEDIAKLRSQIEETYGGVDQWGKPLVVDGGGSFSHMVPSFKDMALEGIDLRNIRRVTSVFGVPGRLIGLDEANSTYNNIQEAKDDFWQRTMYAELMLFEEEFRHKLRIDDSEVFLRFDITGIPAFAEDTTAQVDNFTRLVGNFVPPNEAARISGLKFPEVEGGDISYMPTNLIPVSQVLNPPKPAPTAQVGQDEEETPSDPPQGEGSDMDDVDTPSEEADKTYLPSIEAKIAEWDFQAKSKISNQMDKIAESHESIWHKPILDNFELQKRFVLSTYQDVKKKSLKAHKNFGWNEFENVIRLYFFTTGLVEFELSMTEFIIDLALDARRAWAKEMAVAAVIPDFDLMFMTRASIEGEAWFAGYTLRFAKDINETTQEGIHAVIRDGLAEGYGTDKIGNNLELLFEQYMYGKTNTEDWDFMAERMPPYRTEMIARTETHGAMSNANHAFFKRVGVTKKEWWATADARTRPSHLEAWRTYTEGGTIGAIDIDDYFIVGGYQMKHPGDKSAPLKEFINCRCTELPVI